MAVNARNLTLALLASRSSEATMCPSEVARTMCPGAGWRAAMPSVHAAVDCLLAEGLVRLSWKGKPLADRTGPYRIHACAHTHGHANQTSFGLPASAFRLEGKA